MIFIKPRECHTEAKPDRLQYFVPGYYMYMEADNHNRNAKARLISPTYPGSSTMCLQFWYNMYGANVGKFNVYAKGVSGTSLGAPIWTLAGNQGQDWQLAQQTIPGRGQYSVSQSVTPGSVLADPRASQSTGPTSAKRYCSTIFTY